MSTKFTINIPACAGTKPIRGKVLYSEKHAKRLCKRHPGWTAVEVPEAEVL